MDRQTFGRNGRLLWMPAWTLWFAVLLASVGGMLSMEYYETPLLGSATPFEEVFVYKLLGYGNLLLIASTVVYVLHLWFTADAVGRWASALAGAGALACFLALSTRWFEVYYLHRPGHFLFSALYETVALFTTITVIIYLLMERVYRTRAAGAFVMLIVFAAVLYQVWLATYDQVIPGSRIRILKSYWMHAHVLGNLIGYGAFAVAAATGVAYLLKTGGDGRLPRFTFVSLPEPERLARLMHNAIVLGFPVFTLATVLGSVWAYQAWGRYWAWDPKETWALVVWLTYASYFFFRYVSRWGWRRMAWWSIAGFAITAFCFLGATALWPSLHSLAQTPA
ncbi:MAG TPA: cytochrome c biogenesis protein CcsA [Noviherbaspirillum sp.]